MWLVHHVIQDMRAKVYKHILKLRMTYFDNTPIGSLVTRTISDIETISDIFSQGLFVIIGELLNKSIKPCETALKDAGLQAADIDDVILDGGMTRMTKVNEIVKNLNNSCPGNILSPINKLGTVVIDFEKGSLSTSTILKFNISLFL